MTLPLAGITFKQRLLLAREQAIVQVVYRLLAEKGFDAMTVDEVASQVGLAKASLYKHFSSKEDLGAAAMMQVVQRAQDFIDALSVTASPLEKLRSVLRWALQQKLAGELPCLPGSNSSLRAALLTHRDYMDGLQSVSNSLSSWIEAAQANGQLNPQLPVLVILNTLLARACDPSLEFLQLGQRYTDEQLVNFVVSTCFDGIHAMQ